MILTCLNSNSELLIKLVESKLRKWAEIFVTLREVVCFPRKGSVGNPW